MNRRLPALLPLLLTVVIAGCGGGGDKPTTVAGGKGKPPIGTAAGFKAKASLVPKGDSADADGEGGDYVPTGDIIADSGFRPARDGFSFENYGNDVQPDNLEPANVQDLFGDVVCLPGTEDDCQLTPAAAKWMENQNAGMAGGHCEGFSVLALRMFDDKVDPSDYGASTPARLKIVGNTDLQSAIAEHFTYQYLPPIVDKRVEGTPIQILRKLVANLNSGKELYTLGIYKADLSGGHAITPFAVEDQGDGDYAILVYDNNFPGRTRAVDVDTNDDSWHYVSGTNPKDTDEVYDGDAQTGTLELDPTLPGEDISPCPFCSADRGDDGGEDDGSSDDKGTLLAKDDRYTEITLNGDPRNHPHLVFKDDQGRRTGIVGNRFLHEIPDVEVVKNYGTRNWEGAPEPRFRVPPGKDYEIIVDGTHLKKTARPKINLVGNGLVLDIEDITVAPGQQDAMALPGGYGITYETHAKGDVPEAPNLYAGLVEDGVAYNFAASAVGIKPGSTLSLVVNQQAKVVLLDSTGSSGILGAKTDFILQLSKADAKGHIEQWQRQLKLDGAKEEKAGFRYDTAPKAGRPLDIALFNKNTDVTGVVEAPFVK